MVEHEDGSPQGSVISPLLANIYLHYAFDLWVDVWRRKGAGEVVVVRYADDIILGFSTPSPKPIRFLENFRERLGRFGLELHPDKTRGLSSGDLPNKTETQRKGKPKTFDFLGSSTSAENRLGRFNGEA